MPENKSATRLDRIEEYCRAQIARLDIDLDNSARDGGYNASASITRSVLAKILNMTPWVRFRVAALAYACVRLRESGEAGTESAARLLEQMADEEQNA